MDVAGLRAQFSVLEHTAYLNAGSCGPFSTASARVTDEMLQLAATQGRGQAYFERMIESRTRLRATYAGVLRARPDEVALTTCASEGIVRVLTALDLRPGDEILTSDEEHAGLNGPLAAARVRGIAVRAVPFAQLADAVDERTKLVACSHVSWISGRVAPDLSGLDVAVLLDGAQGVGAVAVDVAALGCAFYAGSGQKWLCGPVGTGMLWISPAWKERLPAPGPTYMNLANAGAGLDAVPHTTAARYDTPAQSLETTSGALAALELLGALGWDAVHDHAATLASKLASALEDAGRRVAPRDATTLVSWEDPDPAATRVQLAEAGVLIRDLPGTGLLRASVGAWNDDTDLDRLLAALDAG